MAAAPSFLVEIALQPQPDAPREDLEWALCALLQHNPDLGVAVRATQFGDKENGSPGYAYAALRRTG
jgi:hypothetical protein